MSNNDCGPGGCTADGLTMQVDEFTMENNRPNAPNGGLTMANICEKASQMQKRFLDGIPSVKEKLCGMWNAMAAHARWRSDATVDVVLKSTESKSIASSSKPTSGELEILIEKPGKCDKPPLNAKFIGDAHGAENIIARRILVANQTLSALTTLASYAWICTFFGWMVSEILAAVCRIEMPEIGGLLDGDQDLYKYYINQISMKLETLVLTIIPPLYAVSSVLVAIVFTNVILFSTGSKSVTPPHSSDTASSIPPAAPTSIIPTAWASRVVAWTTNAAATCTGKVRSTALSWWSSKLMATIQLLVFWILYALSVWSHGVTVTVDPGFLPENEWPYSGDPFGDDHFILYHTSSTSDVLDRSHTSGTSPVFDSAHALGIPLGSFHPIVTSHRTVNMNGNADRVINMRGRYLWYWDDEETRLWVAKHWEGSASSTRNKKAAGHDKSASKPIRRSKWKKNPKGTPMSLENGVSNALDDYMANTNTTTARISSPFHNSFNKQGSDLDIEGEMSDVGISLNFGADKDVRNTSGQISGRGDRKTDYNHKQANYAITGRGGEFSDHPLSLYDQKLLYKMAVNHYFDTVFSDSDRMLASGIFEVSEFTNHIYLNSTAYVAGSTSGGYINSAGHGSTGHVSDAAGYIHRHGGTQTVDYDPTRYVQNPIKHEGMRPIEYNPTRPIHYDPFRRIFVPYGAKYSGICDKYVVGLQTYPPIMMKWISSFIGKPIGFRNQKAFSLFLLYSGMLSCYVLIVLGWKMLGLRWNLKSLALIGAKESKFLDGSLNRGLRQKSSRQEQMDPETDEHLTGKYTKNEVKISVSDRESNITDNNYVTTITEVALDTTSTFVSLKINYLFKSYYLNFVVLGWFLLHGICSVSMMQDALWNGQDVFWNALDNGTGSPYIGNERGIVCNFLPHIACLERNTIQDYILANKGAAFAEIQDPNTEYPSSDSNHVHTPSQEVSIAQSFLQNMHERSGAKTRVVHRAAWSRPPTGSQRMSPMQSISTPVMLQPVVPVVLRRQDVVPRQVNRVDGQRNDLSGALRKASSPGGGTRSLVGTPPLRSISIAFQAMGSNGNSCIIPEDANGLSVVFTQVLPSHLEGDKKQWISSLGWVFQKTGSSPCAAVFHLMSGWPEVNGGNHCRDFVTKIISERDTCTASISEERLTSLKIESLRQKHFDRIYAPLYPESSSVSLFGQKDKVTFMRYGAGGALDEQLFNGKNEVSFYHVFLRELKPLMDILSELNDDINAIHRDIKFGNLVFTSKNPSGEDCKIAIIDWDMAMNADQHQEQITSEDSVRDQGTALFMVVTRSETLPGKLYLRANDQYALMLVAASAMRGTTLTQEVIQFAPHHELKHSYGYLERSGVPTVDIPALLNGLKNAALHYQGKFPKTFWGEPTKKFVKNASHDYWTFFIFAYFKLWDNVDTTDPPPPGFSASWR